MSIQSQIPLEISNIDLKKVYNPTRDINKRVERVYNPFTGINYML